MCELSRFWRFNNQLALLIQPSAYLFGGFVIVAGEQQAQPSKQGGELGEALPLSQGALVGRKSEHDKYPEYCGQPSRRGFP